MGDLLDFTKEFQNLRKEWLEAGAAFFPRHGVLDLELEALSPTSASIEIPAGLTPDQLERLEGIAHPQRRQEWLAARTAELRLKRRLPDEAAGFLTSVTHARSPQGKGVVVAGWLGSAGGEKIQRIGIDLEWVGRDLSEAVAGRIVLPSERKWLGPAGQGLSPLDLWVMKEAAFKANPENQGSWVHEHELVDWDRATACGRVRSQRLDGLGLNCRVRLVTGNPGWKLAFAYSLKSLE